MPDWKNRPTSRTSCGSVATVPRATHWYSFPSEENIKSAKRREQSCAWWQTEPVHRTGTQLSQARLKATRCYCSPPARALSSSDSISRAHSLCLAQCLSVLSLSLLLRRKRCSLVLSRQTRQRGSHVVARERKRECVYVCVREERGFVREDGRGRALLQHLGQRSPTALKKPKHFSGAEIKARTGEDPNDHSRVLPFSQEGRRWFRELWGELVGSEVWNTTTNSTTEAEL